MTRPSLEQLQEARNAVGVLQTIRYAENASNEVPDVDRPICADVEIKDAATNWEWFDEPSWHIPWPSHEQIERELMTALMAGHTVDSICQEAIERIKYVNWWNRMLWSNKRLQELFSPDKSNG